MLAFLKSLFGGGAKAAAPPKAGPWIAYNGFMVQAAPFMEAGQYQTSGVIAKEVEGVRREHRFVRADRFPGYDAAADFAIVKARLMIDQQGERIFQE